MTSVYQCLCTRALSGRRSLLRAAWSAAIAVSLFPLSGATLAQAPAPPEPPQKTAQEAGTLPNAEARLEALRNALIDKALKGPTRIRTSAWIDESGVLRENVQIHSDIKLRGIRMLSYLDQNSSEPSPLRVEAEASVSRLAGLNCAVTGVGQRIKRHAALLSHFTPGQGERGYYFMPELATEAQGKIVKLFAQDDSWVVTPFGETGSTYEQLLYGGGHDAPRNSTYTIRIGLDALDTAPSSPLDQIAKDVFRSLGLESRSLPPLPVRLSLSVEERSSGRVLWRSEAFIYFPEAPVSIGRPALPLELLAGLEANLRSWQKNIQQALACEPLRLEVTLDKAGQFTVAAGTRIGIRAGDQLLLVDRSRFPGNALEKGSLDQAALIEVQSVSVDQALARRVAGPAPNPLQSNLVAMPL